nr:IS3 family transposase [Collimonas antrihumi]
MPAEVPRPDPEVVPTAKRRTFSKAEKLRILTAADACVAPGDIGALLRREGIYSSHLATWRKQRQLGGEAQLIERKRGPKVDPAVAQDRRVLDLENEVERLRDKLAKADLIIDVQKKLSILLGEHCRHARRAEVMSAAISLADKVGVAAACRALHLPRSALYRDRAMRRVCLLPSPLAVAPARRPPLALSQHERRVVLDVLNSPRFANCAPAAIHAQLLDEGRYLASVRTMYRLLQGCAAVRERRNQLRHPEYAKPELLAVTPNQVWSWDITKLKGPVRGTCFHLYVILDIFSRYVVGWMVAEQETAELAEQLIADSAAKESIAPGTLTLHADRGSSMRSKPVAMLLVDLGITKSHSRPYISDDNPYSEAQFKTLKYQPGFPSRFGSLADARAHCATFFAWYNQQHRHSGIGMMTPESVHTGRAAEVRKQRQSTLDCAFRRTPNRFKNRPPQPQKLPTAAWINPPFTEKKAA